MLFKEEMGAEKIIQKFNKLKSKPSPYCHAGSNISSFFISIFDCIKALEIAKNKNWFDPFTFDWREYEKISKFIDGDMNWIIPGKILAMSSPALSKLEGRPPETYLDYFKNNKVKAIVRLNEKLYVETLFIDNDIRIYKMEQ